MKKNAFRSLRGFGTGSLLDTMSHLTAQGLLQELKEIYASGDTKQGLEINVMAFGFKYGMPLDADLVFDVRCFPESVLY